MAYSKRAVQPICAVQDAICAVQNEKLCSPKNTKEANLPLSSNAQTLKCCQLQGALPPDPLTRGSAPGPRWMLRPQTPVISSRSRARHPPLCLIPGSAPGHLAEWTEKLTSNRWSEDQTKWCRTCSTLPLSIRLRLDIMNVACSGVQYVVYYRSEC